MRDERWGGVVERITDQDLQSWCSGPIHAETPYKRIKGTRPPSVKGTYRPHGLGGAN